MIALDETGIRGRVLADPPAMVEALLNLLQNAHRYTPDDKEIVVRCQARRGAVALQIQDNGPGIPQREHRRIFEKFYRVEDPWKRNLDGTGLGLAIVDHIVRGHNGTISLQSEVGRGSTFTILLPTES